MLEEAQEEEEEEEDEQQTSTSGNANSVAKPCKDVFKVYVGEIPFSWDKDTLRKHFSECGDIDWLHMPQDAFGRPAGFAFISYWDQESVEAALELDGRYFGGRKLKVNMASDKPAKLPKEKDLFIGGLPFSCTEDVFRKKKGLKQALKLNGTEMGGREVRVERLLQKSTGEEKAVAEEPATMEEPPRKKQRLAVESGAGGDIAGADAELVAEEQPRKKQKLAVVSEAGGDTADADAEPGKKRRKQVDENIAEEECAAPTEEMILAAKKARKERRKAERLAGLVNQDEEDVFTKEEIIARTKANREARKAKKQTASSKQ